VAEKKSPTHISHAEIKAGVFLTFCLALFVAMLFELGRFGRAWRGRQEISVVFAQVNGLRREAPVFYNGMEIGHVRQIRVLRLTPGELAKLPPFALRDLPNLPLSDLERDTLRSGNPRLESVVNQRVRELIADRTMVLAILDLLHENDTRRFRSDDQYRINGTVTSDSYVCMRTGCGQPLSPNDKKYLLGITGDMYTDLGKSLSQVKDILASLAEIAGGEDTRQTIRGQLGNFEGFTERFEKTTASIQEALPDTWDEIDGRLEKFKGNAKDVEGKLAGMSPAAGDAMDAAQRAILDTRESAATSIDEMREKVAGFRGEAGKLKEQWRKTAADYVDTLPSQLQKAREWPERFTPTIDRIDNFLTRADDQLEKGIDSTRALLHDYTVQATSFEQTTYRLKRWPWSFANKPDEEALAAQDALWRRDLAKRQYVELRGELERLQQNLQSAAPAEQARIARMSELLKDSDRAFIDEKDSGEPRKKGKK
jgi:ABC-type transporter Mla subunit MlaD